MLTGQPVLALAPEEAKALANALGDVLDHHGINLTSGTGSVHLTLILTAVAIYMPKVPALLAMAKPKRRPQAAAPSTPEESLAATLGTGAGVLDLSALSKVN